MVKSVSYYTSEWKSGKAKGGKEKGSVDNSDTALERSSTAAS